MNTKEQINFDDYLPKKYLSEKELWELLRKAHKDGWDGIIERYLEYYAEDEHLWGEHIFDASKYEYGGSVSPEDIQFKIIKALKEFYEH